MTTGFLIGPALAGTALSGPLGGGWFVVLVGLAGAGALAAGALGRRLPVDMNVVN